MFLAVLHVGKLGAVGAALVAALQAATSDPTPLGFLVGATTRATILQVLAASAAVQTAGSNQTLIGYDFTHRTPVGNIATSALLSKN
jgi:hypothetical protein